MFQTTNQKLNGSRLSQPPFRVHPKIPGIHAMVIKKTYFHKFYIGIDPTWSNPNWVSGFPCDAPKPCSCPHAACLGFTTSAGERKTSKAATLDLTRRDPHYLGGLWFRCALEFCKHLSGIFWGLKKMQKHMLHGLLSMQFSRRRWESGHTRRS